MTSIPLELPWTLERMPCKYRVGQETTNIKNTTTIDSQCEPAVPMDISARKQVQVGDQPLRANSEQDTDTDFRVSRIPRMRTVGPGIEARMRLLFNCEGGDVAIGDGLDKATEMVDREVVNIEVEKQVLMNVEEVVTITRRKRTGQRREEGVRVVKLDNWLQRKENPDSQLERKRKHSDGEVPKCKRRKFGTQ